MTTRLSSSSSSSPSSSSSFSLVVCLYVCSLFCVFRPKRKIGVLAGKEKKKGNSQKHHYRSIGLPEEEALTKAGFSLLRIKIKLLLFVTRKRWWCAF
jgi:hypothetical protein